jgi:hypothetical protein
VTLLFFAGDYSYLTPAAFTSTRDPFCPNPRTVKKMPAAAMRKIINISIGKRCGPFRIFFILNTLL